MNSLVIELKQGDRRNYTFIGWQESDYCFYVRDVSNIPKIVEFTTPYPYNRDTGSEIDFFTFEPAVIFPFRFNKISKEFESQWEKACGKLGRIYDVVGGKLAHDAQREVFFGIQFTDKVTYYLKTVTIRNLMIVSEIDEFQKLASVSQPKDQNIEQWWHTPDFRTIRWHDTCGKLIEHSLNNKYQALIRLLAERPGKTVQYAEIESKLGILTRELDLAAGKKDKAATSGPCRIRDIKNEQIGNLLLKSRILLILEGVGKEKSLKLCPPPSMTNPR